MAPSFAELKAKAAKTTSSGVEKLQNMKDRNTSVSMKKTNWDPYSGKPPPPPPPPKSLINQRTKPELAPLPPPPSRTNSIASTSTASRSLSNSPGLAPPLPSRVSSTTRPPLPSRTPSTGPPLPKRPGQTAVSPPSRTGGLPKPASSGPPPPPPPVALSTKPVLNKRDSFYVEDEDPVIDWTNLSQQDKEVFFSWLDEFFSRYLQIDLAPRAIPYPTQPIGSVGGPPPLKASTKPTSWTPLTVGSSNKPFDLVLSHPPAAIHGSAAADLADFFKPTTNWSRPWYHESGIPPPLKGNTNIRYVSSWESRGSVKTTRIGVLFSDLSVFWGAVKFATDDPENQTYLTREAYYLPRALSLDRIKLLEANETYGDTIASFAESFLGTGSYCGRGECWDLASEALKYFDDYDYIPKPVPSISRTHGHLVYQGRASNRGKELVGRWRGGDDRIRRGDIVEWRKVRIATVGVHPGGYSILGDPDHTAVVVSDLVPLASVSDGSSIPPSELGILTVVEQSVGQPPVRKDYNLRGLEEGEMWIYRPVGMETYLGISDLIPTPPDGNSYLKTM